MTACSMMTQCCPMCTGAPCEVRMAPANTTVPAPTWTSPERTAVGATTAVGSITGRCPVCAIRIDLLQDTSHRLLHATQCTLWGNDCLGVFSSHLWCLTPTPHLR